MFSTPDEWRVAEAGLSLFVPMFFRRALDAVWSVESSLADAVLTVPDSLGWADTLVQIVVP